MQDFAEVELEGVVGVKGGSGDGVGLGRETGEDWGVTVYWVGFRARWVGYGGGVVVGGGGVDVFAVLAFWIGVVVGGVFVLWAVLMVSRGCSVGVGRRRI